MIKVTMLAASLLFASSTLAQAFQVDRIEVDDIGQLMASGGAGFVRQIQREAPNILQVQLDDEVLAVRKTAAASPQVLDTAFSRALARAWKIGFVDAGVEGTRTMLLECQRATSVLLTTPFMRSDAQRAHCFRF
jgi:hypothetical protein